MARRQEFPLPRTALAVATVLALAACDTWLGQTDGPLLPGERLPVLVDSRKVNVDEQLRDSEILLPAPTPNESWPQQGGYANHAMHHIAVGETLAEAWDADIGADSDDHERFISSPIIAEGRVFTIDADSMVSAFNPETGEKLWDVELTPDEELSLIHISEPTRPY